MLSSSRTTLREDLKTVKKCDWYSEIETCEVMNYEYEKVFSNSVQNQMLPPSTVHHTPSSSQVDVSLQDFEVSVDEVVKVLTDLKMPSAPGPDTVNPRSPGAPVLLRRAEVELRPPRLRCCP